MTLGIDVAVEELTIDGMLSSHKHSEDSHLRDLQKRVVRYFPELKKHIVSVTEDYCIPGIENKSHSFLVVTHDKRFIASYRPGVDMLTLKEVRMTTISELLFKKHNAYLDSLGGVHIVWKQIRSFPKYEITQTGLIRNIKNGNLIAFRYRKDEYWPSVRLYRDRLGYSEEGESFAIKKNEVIGVRELINETFGKDSVWSTM